MRPVVFWGVWRWGGWCDWPQPQDRGRGEGAKDKSRRMEEGDPRKSGKGASLAQKLFLLVAWVLLALGRYASCCNCAKWS